VNSDDSLKKTLIVGVGNLLLKDEGVGVHAVHRLQEMQLPDNVQVLDAGTAAMDFLTEIQSADRIVFIDAVKAGGEPGTIYRLTPEDVAARGESRLSLHEVGVLEALSMAEHLGGHGDVSIIGVEPKEISWGMELSADLQSKLPALIEAVLAELE